LTPDQLARLGKSLAQADAGELIDGDEVIAELFESAGLPAPEPFNAHRRKS
jgi:predicted transcriptional regulator